MKSYPRRKRGKIKPPKPQVDFKIEDWGRLLFSAQEWLYLVPSACPSVPVVLHSLLGAGGKGRIPAEQGILLLRGSSRASGSNSKDGNPARGAGAAVHHPNGMWETAPASVLLPQGAKNKCKKSPVGAPNKESSLAGNALGILLTLHSTSQALHQVSPPIPQ